MPVDEALLQRLRDRQSRDSNLNIIRGLDGNKDEAAHSVEIESKTGADAEHTYHNYPEVSHAYKSDLVQGVVNSNEMLQRYFNSHPLAATVSKDDVPNLSEYSSAYGRLKHTFGEPWAMPIARGVIAGAKAGFGTDPIGTQVERDLPGMWDAPPFGKVGWMGWAGIETLLRSSSAIAPAIGTGLLEAYKAAGGSDAWGKRFLRDIFPGIEIAVGGAAGGLTGTELAAISRFRATNKFVERALKNGEMPALNVNPIVDRVAAEEAKIGMKDYDETIKAANKSETKELSPEMWSKFVGDKRPIGLKFEAARGLYGDKLPTPGDGLLGDVPNINEMWKKSSFSGEDIQVPFDEWTKVEKETEKLLHDFIRLRPDMMTLDETKRVPEPQAGQWREPRTPSEIQKAEGIPYKEATDKAIKEGWRPPGEPPALSETQQVIKDTRQSMGVEPLQGLLEPGAVMPTREHQRMLKAINDINDKDIKAQMKVEKAKAERELSEDWNREAAEMHPEVTSDVEGRPDFATWRFFNNGEFQGKDMGGLPKIDPQFLSKEQREKFPEHWTSSKGFNPDDLASNLGFRSGDELIDKMIDFRKMKGDSTYQGMKDKVVRAEVKRRMDLKYGDMDELTTQMAREHVTGMKDEDLIWSEIHAMAQQLGQKPQYTRAQVKANAKALFESGRYNEQSVIKYARELARTAADTSKAWLGKDVAEAFRLRQQTAIQLVMAREAAAFEKRLKSDNRIAKSLYKRNPTNMDPEYADWAHDIMQRTEIPTERTEEHLAETIAQRGSHQTLKDFVDSHNIPVNPDSPADVGLPVGYQDFITTYNKNMPIWDKLLDGSHMPLDDMTVREYKAVTNSLRVLKKIGEDKGRDVIDIEGVEHNRTQLATNLARVVKGFEEAKNPLRDEDMALRLWLRRMDAGLKTMSFFMDRLSRFDPTGIWNEVVFNPAMRAEEHWGNMRDSFVPQIRKALEPPKGETNKWFNKQIKENGTFFDPRNPKNELVLDNGSMVAIAAITRRKGGFEHLAAGYKITPDALREFMTRNLTKDHYRIAEKISDVYARAQKLEDEMTMKRSGTMLEKDPVVKVWTPFGEMDSKYYPRTRDHLLDPQTSKVDPHPVNSERIQVEHDWTKEVTGAVYPQLLSIKDLGNDINRRTRHIAITPILDMYNDVLKHPIVRDAMYNHFGDTYNDMIRDFYSDLAGQHGTPTKFEQAFEKFFGAAGKNAITDAVGFNLGVIEKHSVQATIQSLTEFGGKDFLRAAKNLWQTNTYTGTKNHDFIMARSAEIRRRGKYWKDDLSAAADEAMGRMTAFRKVVGGSQYYGTWILSTIDFNVSKAVWLTRYEKEMDAAMGRINSQALSTSEYAAAVQEAEAKADTVAGRAVRDTHGSTSITSKAQMLRSQNPLIKTITPLMNFFNNALMQRYKSILMIKDLKDTPRDIWSDLGRASKNLAVYVVLPTLIEDMVDPICKADDGDGVCAGKFLAQAVAAPLPIVRDVVHSLITGHDPSFGIVWNGAHAIPRLLREGNKWLKDEDVSYPNVIQNTMSLTGAVTGMPLQKPGAWTAYITKLMNERDKPPENLAEWGRVVRWGTTEEAKRPGQRLLPRLMGE